jgi:hypothetical protein
MGLGRRYPAIIDEQRRAHEAHIAEIQAEQDERDAALHRTDHSHIPPLRIAERYAGGIRRKRQATATRSKGMAAMIERWRPKEAFRCDRMARVIGTAHSCRQRRRPAW